PEPPDRTAPARRPNRCAESLDRRCLEACMARESRLSGRHPAAPSRAQAGIENSGSARVASAQAVRRLFLLAVPGPLAARKPVVQEAFAAEDFAQELSQPLQKAPN